MLFHKTFLNVMVWSNPRTDYEDWSVVSGGKTVLFLSVKAPPNIVNFVDTSNISAPYHQHFIMFSTFSTNILSFCVVNQ